MATIAWARPESRDESDGDISEESADLWLIEGTGDNRNGELIGSGVDADCRVRDDSWSTARHVCGRIGIAMVVFSVPFGGLLQLFETVGLTFLCGLLFVVAAVVSFGNRYV